jgi:hypothetical protein
MREGRLYYIVETRMQWHQVLCCNTSTRYDTIATVCDRGVAVAV